MHAHIHGELPFIPSISGVVDIVWTKVFQTELKVLKTTNRIHSSNFISTLHTVQTTGKRIPKTKLAEITQDKVVLFHLFVNKITEVYLN